MTHDSPQALANGMEKLLRHEEDRRELGRRGKEAVHRSFSAEAMARETLDIYNRVLSGSEVLVAVRSGASA